MTNRNKCQWRRKNSVLILDNYPKHNHCFTRFCVPILVFVLHKSRKHAVNLLFFWSAIFPVDFEVMACLKRKKRYFSRLNFCSRTIFLFLSRLLAFKFFCFVVCVKKKFRRCSKLALAKWSKLKCVGSCDLGTRDDAWKTNSSKKNVYFDDDSCDFSWGFRDSPPSMLLLLVFFSIYLLWCSNLLISTLFQLGPRFFLGWDVFDVNFLCCNCCFFSILFLSK